MLHPIRLHLARRAFARALVAFNSYQTQPATGAWRFAIADALHVRLIKAERHLAALMVR